MEQTVDTPRSFYGRAGSMWGQHENAPLDYDKLWAISRHVAPQKVTTETERLKYAKVLTAKESGEWRKLIDDDSITDDLRIRFCETVFSHLDDYLTSYFGCYYLPLFLRFYANKPGDELPYAASWHCDAGPRKHLKVLLYLNGSDASGGNTEFVDYDTTMRFDEIGYLFCALNQRLDDVSKMAKSGGIPFKPIRKRITAGEAVIFEPACIMHRAVWPKDATRYMAQICLLPSPKPWHDACSELGLPRKSNEWVPFKIME